MRIVLDEARLRYTFENSTFEQAGYGKNLSLLIENNRAEFNQVKHIEFEDTYVEPCFRPITIGSWQLTSANIRLLPNVPAQKTFRWFQK
ncbi:MAG: hypothetical protein U5L96_20490 [Owenweeksia sp.]|nr:hypothetical protein [Owenweeksia sp.]